MVRPTRARGNAKRVAAAILLAVMPLPLFAGTDGHLGHGADAAETTIFADAVHAGQANHWEAASSAVTSRCLDCLAPAQSPALPSNGSGRGIRCADESAPATEAGSPPDGEASRSPQPRAPPSS